MIDYTIQIGCGGTGGILGPMLARLLAYHQNSSARILFVDGDEFEEKNVTRQIVGPDQLGRNKAEVMLDLCSLQGLTAASALDKYLNYKMLPRITRGFQFPLFVCAVDNDATRAEVLKYCLEDCPNFFWVSPGNADDSDGTAPIRGQVVWYGRYNGKVFGSNPLEMFPQLENPTDRVPEAGSCANQAPSAPQLITSNAMAASLTLAVVQNFLDQTLSDTTYNTVFNAREVIKAATL